MRGPPEVAPTQGVSGGVDLLLKSAPADETELYFAKNVFR